MQTATSLGELRQNNLSIDMWKNSEGEEIKKMLRCIRGADPPWKSMAGLRGTD